MLGIYTEDEMVARYNAWEMDCEKDEYISVLADLNATSRAKIKEMLERHGCRIPASSRRLRTYAQWEIDMMAEMREAGRTVKEIAKELGRSANAVAQKMRMMGLELPEFWSEEKEAELVRLREAGYTNKYIANALGMSRNSVWKKAKELTAPRQRRWSSAEVERLKQMYKSGMKSGIIAETLGREYNNVAAKISYMRKKGEL